MKVTFPTIERKQRITAVCTKCQKKKTRTFAYSNTVSPYNQHPDGTTRTRDEIVANVKAKLAEMVAAPFVCKGCEENTK